MMRTLHPALRTTLALLLITGCSEQQQPADPAEQNAASGAAAAARPDSFAVDLTKDAIYTVAVWKTAAEGHDTVVRRLTGAALPASARRAVLMRANDRTAVVQVIHWSAAGEADAFMASQRSEPAATRARQFRVVDSSLAAGAPRELRLGSSVQWSEFLMREPKMVAELSPMVTGMTSAMAQGGGAPDLQTIVQLRSADDRSIGLLGIWRTRDGFETFARNKTFGERGYWEPYAENEHWMMEVVSVR